MIDTKIVPTMLVEFVRGASENDTILGLRALRRQPVHFVDADVVELFLIEEEVELELDEERAVEDDELPADDSEVYDLEVEEKELLEEDVLEMLLAEDRDEDEDGEDVDISDSGEECEDDREVKLLDCDEGLGEGDGRAEVELAEDVNSGSKAASSEVDILNGPVAASFRQ